MFKKIAQIDMFSFVPDLDYLDGLFQRLSRGGYNAVLLAYRNKFPYASYPTLAAPTAYSAGDIERIEAMARQHALEVIPLGFQFSHSADILTFKSFKPLDGGGSALDLTQNESVEVIARTGEDLLNAHPGARIIHCGGDEISTFGYTPRTGRFIREHGVSAYYVQFVNRLAARFARRGVRLAIWSDMLIRYPQAIDQLDRSVIINYWDYWSFGERTPFVSIGGGLPDMFLFDRGALQGDLQKLFLSPWARPAEEIPTGHRQRFGRYWDLDRPEHSARSFPYCAWFRELGFTVIGAFMTYPEKSSFLPDFLGKFDHVRGFARRLRENGAAGAMSCLWQPHWPLLETCLPAFLSAACWLDDPDASEASVLSDTAARLGAPWTEATLRAYLGAGRDFESADLMSPLWNDRLPLFERFASLRESGAWEADLALCRGSLARVEALLNDWHGLATDAYERFVLEDLAWRARIQLAWDTGDAAALSRTRNDGRDLEARFTQWASTLYRPAHQAELRQSRYQPWLAS